MLGGACPSVTSLIARALPALGLLQVSFEAPPPSLSNRKWYRHLVSTAPPVRAMNLATVKLLQRYRWRRVGLLTQDRPGLAEMTRDLIRQLLRADVQLAAAERFSGDACSGLRRLQDEDVRIIVGHFEDGSVTDVFCCAFRLGLFGPRYQWILAAGRPSGWRLGWQPSSCSASSLLTAADGSFRLQVRQLSSTDTPGVSGRTPQEYLELYLKQLNQEGSEVNPLHAFAYDAVWLAARVLVQVKETARKFGSLRNVSVGEEEEGKMLLEAVKSTHFEGVTGPVSFRNGERMTVIELIQFQGDSGVLVGEFNTSHQQVRVLNQLLRFKGPGPARDQTLVRQQPLRVGLLLYCVLSAAAVGTIFITLTVLCIIIIGRWRWPRRPGASPQDELLLLGLLLSSASVLFSGLDRTSLPDPTLEIFCSVRLWTLSLGHTVGLAALLTRTWRVYFVCSVRLKNQLQETGRVQLWILLLDLLVLTSWQILDPLRWEVLQHRLEDSAADQDVVIQSFSERCSSANMELWLTAVCGFKAPLLGLGCFLAWNIRAAAVSGRLLAVSMFSLTGFSASAAAGSLLTSSDPAAQFCLCSIFILSCNLFILMGLFAPQVFCLLSSSCSNSSCSSGELQQVELQADAAEEAGVERLRRRNQELRSQSGQLDVQIETIAMELSATLQQETGCGAAPQLCTARPPAEENINSPERVRRRLSMQLPILHHSYLPVVGGVRSSSSSLFGEQEVVAPRHQDHFLYS
ncbi:gamma-aminobutyric acid type B receptor subunit 2-like isoform X1 [Xiphophorus hellerii]|uniref:gamma-aminobutyric acid type B receptor subunit 2-like isoform X1 n=1 Tax=Xiphophorus hellerii TaxID=8084 RepID=UPI0013B4658A|nr:gamma-aminobutyric acid type B receptor subunit 2-like isoform X1 [Xiphophorus hellerii]